MPRIFSFKRELEDPPVPHRFSKRGVQESLFQRQADAPIGVGQEPLGYLD